MDLSFSGMNDARLAAPSPELDYRHLVASLAVAQAATQAARIEMAFAAPFARPVGQTQALVTLLAGKRGWQGAVAELRGSFHAATARLLADKPA